MKSKTELCQITLKYGVLEMLLQLIYCCVWHAKRAVISLHFILFRFFFLGNLTEYVNVENSLYSNSMKKKITAK